MDTKKMRACSNLLPDPGGEVVRECLDEIEKLRTLIADIKVWDVDQYMAIPHKLRARIEDVLVPNCEVSGGAKRSPP